LADAVKARGITFSLTPEIEKELGGGGADPMLVAAIREKNPAPKMIETAPPKPVPAPVATPTPLDSNYYQKRAESFIIKGDLDSAIADFNKAIELKSTDQLPYLNRGLAFHNKKNYELSIADFTKVIELNPASSVAHFNRANSYERLGDTEKAMADYRKAADLDPANEQAKKDLQRLVAEQQAKVKPEPKLEPKETAPPPTAPTASITNPSTATNGATVPKSTASLPANVGSLKNYAVKLAMPIYSAIDRQRNVQGIVTVEISLDEEGKILSVKAVSGPPSLRNAAEEAARKSKFKAVTVGEKTIKATGFINYNFAGS
jgi:TonB family protein